jgi:hypothetical protein
MTRRTRYFMVGSALIVVLGLCTGLVAYYNGDLPVFRSRVGPEELLYIPADATGVAYANVREIMNSDFRQRLHQVIPTGQAKDQFFNETGIDIEHDIDSVVAASNASAIGSGGRFPGIVLVRGRFDEGRIETLVRQHDGAVEEYKGKRLLLVAKSGTDEHGMCLTFPETGLALLGEQGAVKKAIDTHASRGNVTGNAELMKFIGQMDGGVNTAWAVGGLDAVTKDTNLPPQIRDNLPGVQWVAVSAHINGGLSGMLRAEARDDKAAEDLRAVVNGATAAARLMGGKDQRLDAIVNSLQMGGTGKNVELAFTLPPEVLDLIHAAPGLNNSPGPAREVPRR